MQIDIEKRGLPGRRAHHVLIPDLLEQGAFLRHGLKHILSTKVRVGPGL
jgi:hypothetical protein